MKKKVLWIAVSVLVVLGLVIGACAKQPATTTAPTVPAPSPTASPAPTAKPSPSPSPTASPAPKPTTVAPTPAQPAQIKWTVEASYTWSDAPERFKKFGYYGSGARAIYIADVLNRATGGRLKVDVVPPGAIVPVADIYKAVSAGTIDGAWHAFSSSWTGLYPEAFMEAGMTFGWQNGWEVWDAMYHLGMQDLIQEANDQFGVWNVITSDNDRYTWFTNFEPTSPSTFKGKKFQAWGMNGEWVKALGGSPTSIPGPDRYMALKLGTIDGANDSFMDGAMNRKLTEVTKYVVLEPKTTNPIGISFLTNKKSVEALPEDVRKIVKEVLPLAAWNYSNTNEAREELAMLSVVKSGALKTVSWSKEDTMKAIELAQTLWEDFGKKSPRTAKLLELLKQQLRDYGRLK